ncbi:hypothetical protein SAMN06298216_3621 [Spirosomataceae bacterium TFI 002]|nr:hypothetical protein SAMN06298216_3621 [Spirosomataceae bacterium TFI 002]
MNIIEHPFFDRKGEPKSITKSLELPESNSSSYKSLPIHRPMAKPFFQPRYATDVTFYNPVESNRSYSHYEREDKPESSNSIWWIIGFLLLSLIGYSLWRHLVPDRDEG